MLELSVIEKTGLFLSTVDSLKAELGSLGIRGGDLVLMHSSLSALGWVCGGAVAVIHGLLALLGDEGTLMAPAHTGDNTEPSRWKNPPVPESWWESIRASFPLKKWMREGTSVQRDGARKWVQFDMMELSDDDFECIGEAFEPECPVAAGLVGSGKARLIDCMSLIDFAVAWMERQR